VTLTDPERAPDQALRTPSNLKLRMIASVGMIVVASIALTLGGIAFWLLGVVAALFMMAEWAMLQGADAKTRRMTQFALSVPLALMAPASLILVVHDFFTLGLLAGAAFFVVITTRKPPLALGIIYCGLPVLALMIIRRQEDGVLLTLWALSLVWACDIGAFFTGRSLGGPKLAPVISPNKTWSGLIGGVVLAGIVAAILHVEYALPFHLALATPFLAALAQMGDLYESWLKRVAGVKDSGNTLPGHGGVMDRLDGLVPVAPVAALLIMLPSLYS
jgi:CDP-diglyceride synthetase